MNKLTIVQADDWEGLFVNGNLLDEGHTLYEGISPVQYWKEKFTEYGLDAEIEEYWVTSKYYRDYLSQYGRFPNNLDEVELDRD